MGLYLCVFKGDNELDGVEVGFYEDYGVFIDTVVRELEDNNPGSKYSLLSLHHDSDGEWSVEECKIVRNYLIDISNKFKMLPPCNFNSKWKEEVARQIGLKPQNLYDCFIDIDGEPLLERLILLCDLAVKENEPILFQ